MARLILIIAIILIIIAFALFAPKIRIMMVLSGGSRGAYYAFRHKLFLVEQGKILLLADGTISVVNKKTILLEKQLPKELMLIFIKKLQKIIKIKNLSIYLSMQGKSMEEALAMGAVDAFGGIIMSILQSFNIKDVKIISTKTKERGALALDTNIKISVLKMVLCFIGAKHEYKKLIKDKGEQYAKTN